MASLFMGQKAIVDWVDPAFYDRPTVPSRPLTFEERVALALAKLPRQNGPNKLLRLDKFAAFGGATAFTALALYTSWVEQPVRLELDDASALKQWRRSYSRAMPIQLGLVLFTSLQGMAIVWKSGQKMWLLGSLLMLANLPYTYLYIMPLNRKLMATGTREDLLRWGKLHGLRSLLGCAAVAVFAYAALFDGQWLIRGEARFLGRRRSRWCH